MKKITLISGLAILFMASGNEIVKGAATAHINGAPASVSTQSSTITQASFQDSTAIKVVNRFFERFQSGASPEELASLFDEKAEMFIPGDTKTVPWIGKRIGRKAIANSFRLLRENIKPIKLDFIDMLSKGDRVVILGYLESRMKKNGKVMKSEFCIDIVVKNGLLTRYHILEDSFEVSNKAKL
jgi:ketosteroid isomerase-like protein